AAAHPSLQQGHRLHGLVAADSLRCPRLLLLHPQLFGLELLRTTGRSLAQRLRRRGHHHALRRLSREADQPLLAPGLHLFNLARRGFELRRYGVRGAAIVLTHGSTNPAPVCSWPALPYS